MSHRSRQIPGAAGVQLGMIITPMLDMSFQLLAFFIMIYSPSALEGHLAGKLASPVKDAAVKANDPAMLDPTALSDADPELTESLVIRTEAVPPEPAKITDDERAQRKDKYGAWRDGEPFVLKIVTKVDLVGQIIWDERFVPKRDITRTDRPLLAINFKALTDKLKQETDKGAKKMNIRIDNPDGNLKHLSTIYLYDACKTAGFQNISFVPPQVVREPASR